MVGLPLRGVRVFRHFAQREIVSDKMALSRPARQPHQGADAIPQKGHTHTRRALRRGATQTQAVSPHYERI
jgi:hypothetical protein